MRNLITPETVFEILVDQRTAVTRVKPMFCKIDKLVHHLQRCNKTSDTVKLVIMIMIQIITACLILNELKNSINKRLIGGNQLLLN